MPGTTLCSRLHCHRDDPSLDDPIPQEFALFLCPTGPLLEELQAFWRESQRQCSRNRAHEVFPHITLCDFFTVSAPQVPEVTFLTQSRVGATSWLRVVQELGHILCFHSGSGQLLQSPTYLTLPFLKLSPGVPIEETADPHSTHL